MKQTIFWTPYSSQYYVNISAIKNKTLDDWRFATLQANHKVILDHLITLKFCFLCKHYVISSLTWFEMHKAKKKVNHPNQAMQDLLQFFHQSYAASWQRCIFMPGYDNHVDRRLPTTSPANINKFPSRDAEYERAKDVHTNNLFDVITVTTLVSRRSFHYHYTN